EVGFIRLRSPFVAKSGKPDFAWGGSSLWRAYSSIPQRSRLVVHPAISIIFFTCAAGAGYGLLTMLGALAVLRRLPPDRTLGIVSLGIALTLIVGGLLSSTLHLRRPERAWRALSQWRSSWLSREGIASLLTFVPAILFGLGWLILTRTDGFVALAGAASAVSA